MKKGVLIDGTIYSHAGDVDQEIFLDRFITWIESEGLSFGGSTTPVDEDGEKLDPLSTKNEPDKCYICCENIEIYRQLFGYTLCPTCYEKHTQ